jgi:hypothetical protein
MLPASLAKAGLAVYLRPPAFKSIHRQPQTCLMFPIIFCARLLAAWKVTIEIRSEHMSEKVTNEFIDAGTAEREQYEAGEEVQQEFADAQRLGSGAEQLKRELREHHSRTPRLSAGDLDADWARADIGDETVGGSSPTPDQDIVEELGEAIGLTYEDNEPLHTTEKVEERDHHRWELDPASSEDYSDRVNREGE